MDLSRAQLRPPRRPQSQLPPTPAPGRNMDVPERLAVIERAMSSTSACQMPSATPCSAPNARVRSTQVSDCRGQSGLGAAGRSGLAPSLGRSSGAVVRLH